MRKRAGVTLIETLLVLSLSAAITVVSIRYYEVTVAAHQSNRLVSDIMSLTSTIDGLAVNGSYLDIDNAMVKTVLSPQALNTPWGTAMTIHPKTAHSYEVIVPSTPARVCARVANQLLGNNNYTVLSTCQTKASDFHYSYSSIG